MTGIFILFCYGVGVDVGVSVLGAGVSVTVAVAGSLVFVIVGVAVALGAIVVFVALGVTVFVGTTDAEALKICGATHKALSPEAGPVASTVKINFMF